MAKNSLWSIIPSCTDLLTNISTQSSLFLAKCNNLFCFFFPVFVSYCSFLTTPELKQNSKEKIEDINPGNCFLPLTWAKIFVPERTVKNTVKILSA